MTYAPDATALVGNTPLVRINRVTDGAPATVLAKVEAFEPAASVKDRIALSIVRAAEASGDLKPGGTIVEATSGNTGVGLAMVGAALGYKVIITMPETMSKERRAIMRAFGAELVLTTDGGVAGAVKRAEEIQAATPNSILASQFANPANPKIHRETTAREILEQTGGDIDVFVAGIGTGGTLTGVGQVLRQEKPGVKIYGVEPSESPLLSEGQAAPHKIQGLGPNVVSGTSCSTSSPTSPSLTLAGPLRRRVSWWGSPRAPLWPPPASWPGALSSRARPSSPSCLTPVSVTCPRPCSRTSSTDSPDGGEPGNR